VVGGERFELPTLSV